MATLAQAKIIKAIIKQYFIINENPNFEGVGINGNKKKGYGVKVNFHKPPAKIPPFINTNAVPITVEITGSIKKHKKIKK
ncbi:hypothetical protein GW933_00885 [Candidatus Falkowbacteria bacterium]|uniref:Uncharacterized protein n=1 Tax=Candidatus Buchananbacteria bacterium CG10_big_fil_rev_8_21_14_0_10_33_19 TaxID=1974525 RepID=A0A2H0W3F0_9BACT|nr:hypothetical protein [Candidatus Falkowbacteria bacterium]PIS05807.1 MAG: hypothetical protein COT80_03515 [Candidatus Buchananbacteria bacterium CG10_big_fil_rev_8_21_14_0_10_33_19]